MQLSEEEKDRTVLHLAEMFGLTNEEQVRCLCDSNDWDVKACVDKLVRASLAPNLDEAATAEAADTTQNFAGVAERFQIPLKGAIPKNKSKRNNNNNNNNTNNESGSSKQTFNAQFPLDSAKATANRTSYSNNSKAIGQNHKFYADAVYQRICSEIKACYRVMVFMRGPSGSGKSTLAEHLVRESVDIDHTTGCKIGDFLLSTDDYWIDSRGKYNFDHTLLSEAHDWNQKRARDKALAGCSPIVIDNTNAQLWQMMPYVQIAVQNGYIVELLEPNTSWRYSASKLFLRSKHKVPRETIQNMLERYEKADVNDLMKLLKETKYTVKLPLQRLWPPIAQAADNQVEDEVCETFKDMTVAEQLLSAPVEELQSESAWMDYVDPTAPKTQRSKSRNHSKVASDAETAATSLLQQHQQQQQSQPNWPSYENESALYWAQLSEQPEATTNHVPKSGNSGKSLLELLRESVDENEKVDVPSKESHQNKQTNNSNELRRHRVDCPNEESSFVLLRQIYPNKQVSDLWDLFVKCNGDVDWAVDLLLKEDELALNNEPSSSHDVEDDFNCDCFNATESKSSFEKPTPLNISMLDTNLITPTSITTARPQRKPRNARRTNPNLREVQLQIENCFELSDEQYSNHIRKIRDIRNGVLDVPIPMQMPTPDHLSSSTAAPNWLQMTEPPGEDNEADDNGHNDTTLLAEENELLEFDLGENLVTQLCNAFKSESELGELLPDHYATNVFMKRSLAKQLYLLWKETVYNQMEELRQQQLHEDEQYARLLKNPKYENYTQTPHNVNELLDMELAWNIYNDDKKRQNERLAELTKPNDIATHLTKMKLCEQFPDIPADTLLDVYEAQNRNYINTLKALGVDDSCALAQPELIIKQDGLIELVKRENEVLNRQAVAQQVDGQRPMYGDDSSSNNNHVNSMDVEDENKHHALHEFEKTRNMAAHHSQLKAECYQKAKEAIQKGNGGAAIYYSEIANLHKMKIDIYNHRAANCIMLVHKYTQNNPDNLDLHYLHVIEAIGCLDLFLDQHITALRMAKRPYKHVFIITGRGLHSAGGVSTIKNKVKARLKERNLKWSDVNPGLLKVKIFSASRHSKNI